MKAFDETLTRTFISDLIMVFLSVVSVFLLILEVVTPQNPAQLQVIDFTDLIISLIFLGDFGVDPVPRTAVPFAN